jgi:hypothetical protein
MDVTYLVPSVKSSEALRVASMHGHAGVVSILFPDLRLLVEINELSDIHWNAVEVSSDPRA